MVKLTYSIYVGMGERCAKSRKGFRTVSFPSLTWLKKACSDERSSFGESGAAQVRVRVLRREKLIGTAVPERAGRQAADADPVSLKEGIPEET